MGWVIFTLFLISGACGLIYEVVWSRMMMLIFGRSVLSVGIVLAAFMSGLALGSYLLGRTADRSRDPLRLYALYEMGVGLTALIASFFLTRTMPVHIWIHNIFGESLLIHFVARFLMVFAILIIPTALMGATLPLLSRVMLIRLSRVAQEMGLLYAINTIGAVVGSLASGFYLIGRFGLERTVYIAVFGNLLVGALAWITSKRINLATMPVSTSPSENIISPASTQDIRIRRMYLLVLWAFMLSGFASFAYEIFWTRALVFVIGSTTYSFSLMLASFLAGIAIGGYGIRYLADTVKDPLHLFGIIEIIIGVVSAAALPLLFIIVQSETVRVFVNRFSGNLELLALSNFIIALSLMLLPAVLIGATFPLVGRILVSDLQNTGKSVGKIYAFNTLGNVLGALLPGLLIMPIMGIQKGVLLMASMNVSIGIVVLLCRKKHALVVASASLTVILVFALILARVPIPFQFPSIDQTSKDKVLFYKEGGLVTTKVWLDVKNGYKLISVDGINIGGTSDSDYKQQILAHLPKMLLKSYSSELSVGLGSGILIGESARHAALKKIVCVEISHGVADGARHFTKENFGILDDPRAVIIVDDVIDFLETTTERYDIISADEKTTGKYASNSFSYSTEYYALLKRRLAPGGLVVQWVPTDLPSSQYSLVLRTFLDEFPHVLLWYFPPVGKFGLSNTVLVGSNEQIDIDPTRMRYAMDADAASFQGLRKYGLTTAESVLAHYVGNEESLRRAIAPGPVNTFDHPYYEFYSPGEYAVPSDARVLANHEMLMSMRSADFDRSIANGIPGAITEAMKTAYQAEGVFLKKLGAQLGGQSLPDEIIPYYERAIKMAPWNKNLRLEVLSFLYREYGRHYAMNDVAGATDFLRRAADLDPEESDTHFEYGSMLWRVEQTDLAVREFEKTLTLNPQHAGARQKLASIYASRGQVEKAVDQWKACLALDPDNVVSLVEYGIFLAEQRPNTESIEYLQKAYRLDPHDPNVIDGYARVEYLNGNESEARGIVLKGGRYYKGNPDFEKLRQLILGAN